MMVGLNVDFCEWVNILSYTYEYNKKVGIYENEKDTLCFIGVNDDIITRCLFPERRTWSMSSGLTTQLFIQFYISIMIKGMPFNY